MNFFFRFLLLIGISVLVEFYAFQGLKTLIQSLPPVSKKTIKVVYWIASGIFYLLLLFILFNIGKRQEYRSLISFVFSYFLVLTVPKLFVTFFLLLEDLARFFEWIFVEKASKGSFPSRRQFVSTIAFALAAIPFAGLVFGAIKGQYHFRLHKKDIFFKDLPDEFDGFTLLQLSDIHSGTFDSASGLQKGIDLINAQQFDLCVFTGDMVNNKATELTPWMSHFKSIRKPEFGMYGVLGNHDYGDYVQWESEDEKKANLQKLIDQNEEVGFKMLLNEHVTLEKGSAKVTLAGVENWGERPFPQYGDLDKALSNSEENFTILLSHDPTHWTQKVIDFGRKIHLTLSGHTHGMQFGVELGNIRWSPVKYRYPKWIDLYTEKDQNLYVNRGFGCLGFEGRVGIWPEVALLTLRKA